MNNLKFRAWDALHNEMVYSDKEDAFYINTKGVLFMYTIPKSESGLETTYHKDYNIMQFTGKRCFDGTEIYEGDILLQGGVYVPIIWNKEDACFELNFGIRCLHGLPLTNIGLDDLCDKAIIVGNIYENKELLSYE